MHLQMQPSIKLAFVAAVAYYWLLFSLLSTKTAKFLSARLCPSCTDPGLHWVLWLCCPRCRTLLLPLLNFILFLQAHSSSLSRSFCKMSLLSDMSTSQQYSLTFDKWMSYIMNEGCSEWEWRQQTGKSRNFISINMNVLVILRTKKLESKGEAEAISSPSVPCSD